MFIETESTPNPLSLKFIPGISLVETPMDFPNAAAAKASPLATRLFEITGVDGVFIGHDFMTVTKSEAVDWYTLKPILLGIMMEFFVNKKPLVGECPSSTPVVDAELIEGDDKEAIKQILILLDEKIRPAVAQDGGDIVLEKFIDGVVYLRLKGSCSGCPSSTFTLKNGIENMLRYYLPDVKEVRSV